MTPNFSDLFEMSNYFDNDSFFGKSIGEISLLEQDNYSDKDNDFNNENYYETNNCNLNFKYERTTSDSIKKKTNKKENNQICWTLDSIKINIFDKEEYKNIFTSDIKCKIKEDIQIDEPFLNKKRSREFTVINDIYDPIDNENKNQIEGKTIKRGRKLKNEEGERKHNKKSADNIIKKVKSKLFKFCIWFLNNIIKKSDRTEFIYDLNYQYINKLKKNIDLKFISMSLKDLFSLNISPKYEDKAIDTNKINIQNLLCDNQDETLKFCFDMTFGDWIDIFTYKKKVSEILLKYFDDNHDGIDVTKIEDNLIRVDALLKEIAKNNNDEYFSLFTFYLYNYELWFSSKHGRNRKQKK